jgi:hypothetical protein
MADFVCPQCLHEIGASVRIGAPGVGTATAAGGGQGSGEAGTSGGGGVAEAAERADALLSQLR